MTEQAQQQEGASKGLNVAVENNGEQQEGDWGDVVESHSVQTSVLKPEVLKEGETKDTVLKNKWKVELEKTWSPAWSWS